MRIRAVFTSERCRRHSPAKGLIPRLWPCLQGTTRCHSDRSIRRCPPEPTKAFSAPHPAFGVGAVVPWPAGNARTECQTTLDSVWSACAAWRAGAPPMRSECRGTLDFEDRCVVANALAILLSCRCGREYMIGVNSAIALAAFSWPPVRVRETRHL